MNRWRRSVATLSAVAGLRGRSRSQLAAALSTAYLDATIPARCPANRAAASGAYRVAVAGGTREKKAAEQGELFG